MVAQPFGLAPETFLWISITAWATPINKVSRGFGGRLGRIILPTLRGRPWPRRGQPRPSLANCARGRCLVCGDHFPFRLEPKDTLGFLSRPRWLATGRKARSKLVFGINVTGNSLRSSPLSMGGIMDGNKLQPDHPPARGSLFFTILLFCVSLGTKFRLAVLTPYGSRIRVCNGRGSSLLGGFGFENLYVKAIGNDKTLPSPIDKSHPAVELFPTMVPPTELKLAFPPHCGTDHRYFYIVSSLWAAGKKKLLLRKTHRGPKCGSLSSHQLVARYFKMGIAFFGKIHLQNKPLRP